MKQRSDADRLIEELAASLRATAEAVVPRFLAQMPRSYFEETDESTRLTHLRAVLAARASGQPLEVTLRSDDGRRWTFIRDRDYPGLLAEMMSRLPSGRPLRTARVHSAADGHVVLNVFEFGDPPPFDPSTPQAAALRDTLRAEAGAAADALDAHLRHCAHAYVMRLRPERILQQFALCRRLSGTDGVDVELLDGASDDSSVIHFAASNARPRELFLRIARRLSRYEVDVRGAHLDNIEDPPHGLISMLSLVVRSEGGAALDRACEPWPSIRRDLLRLKWVDDGLLAAAHAPEVGLVEAEVLRALCSLSHQILWRDNRYAFARERLFELAERHQEITLAVARLLLGRFDADSPLGDAAFAVRAGELRGRVQHAVADEDARRFIDCLIRIVESTLRCNASLDGRYALALRLDPAVLDRDGREHPYGVFFVHGRGFDAFHVRFRDIARGGVRAVRPHNAEQHLYDTERLYDEVYDLAWAQQLKNKDIPEGGSKAVVLVEPGTDPEACVKAFADALLDLITPEPEMLYLGPDENISPALIEWIVARADRRGYPMPSAFMSSKPGTGINHKEYGVTSEGLTVFLEAALRAIGIDPRVQEFTVKLTGGPDGDVAGNELRILQREFRERAKVVGLADGSGVGEDPDGLSSRELMRLVEAGLPIAEFDRRELGPRGRIVGVDDPEGALLRNSMHNRVVAHAFIPAGGRPETIHAGNWREFLDDAGRPTSSVIVEGANLFLTPEARERLASEAGVLVVKDSSANKTGVICSSYEIVASMALDESELREIKPEFVVQVLEKLRALAGREAQLLFHEHRHKPDVSLPVLSVRVSEVINRAADAIAGGLERLGMDEADLAWDVIVEHLPPVLVARAGDRLRTRIPLAYLNRVAASSLAARIVYREGLSFLEALTGDVLGGLAMRYLRQEKETRRLVEAVEGSKLPDRERIAELLRRGGTRGGLGTH